MKRKLVIGMILLLCAAAGCSKEKSADTSQAVQESVVSDETDNVENSSDESIKYTKEDMDSSFSANNENQIKLTTAGASVSGQSLKLEDNTVSITEEGTYVVSGSASDVRIVVNLKENGTVKLVLNNASLSCKEDAPIYCKKGKLILTLAEATSNYIEDSDTYVSADKDGNPSAAIFSKDDMTVNGTGSLEVKANYKNAIQSKKILKVVTGTYKINAVESGFVGRGGAIIRNGNYSIVSTGQNETMITDAPEMSTESK